MKLLYFKVSLVLIIALCSLTSCSSNSNDVMEVPTNISGTGFFEYSDYIPLENKPIKIYYHVPAATNQNTPIVFIFHGAGRNAQDYRNATISKANEHGFIVIAPEFSTTYFPGGDAYNLGNVFKDGDNPSATTLLTENEWTFSLIEPIFDFIKPKTNSNTTKYHIIGHSAGGQFAHRFTMFKPNARFDKVVASASGWYTVSDVLIDFPYGFKESPLENSSFNTLFSKNIIIQVGNLDNDPNAGGLRHNVYADAQGLNRYDRANHFYNNASTIALNNAIPFTWKIHIHAGLDHSYAPAIEKAADLLFN